MQRSRPPTCAFPLLAYRLPIPFQRFPNWFPILRRRFHDYFLDFLLEQPCGQRSLLFGVAAKHPPLKPELTVNFHVRHNYSQHLFMNINSRYPVRHKLLLAGSGERAAVTLTRVAGYRRSRRGNNDAQLSAQTRTLRIRQDDGLDLSIAASTSPPRAVAILPLSDFHEVSRAAGPK